MKRFNYLSLLSLLSLTSLVLIFDRNGDMRLLMTLGYLGYISYYFVTPDELFNKHVLRSASITMFIALIIMSLFTILIYLSDSYQAVLETGFWVTFAVLHIAFNVLLTYFLNSDGRYAKEK